ncbi:MAG: hypothetical protein ACYTAO_21640 [Planctomycetota bacterium]
MTSSRQTRKYSSAMDAGVEIPKVGARLFLVGRFGGPEQIVPGGVVRPPCVVQVLYFLVPGFQVLEESDFSRLVGRRSEGGEGQRDLFAPRPRQFVVDEDPETPGVVP